MFKGIIPAKYTHIVSAFYMAVFIAFLMSFVFVALNTGIDNGYIQRVIRNYVIAMPVAFIFVVLFRPFIMKLVYWTIIKP